MSLKEGSKVRFKSFSAYKGLLYYEDPKEKEGVILSLFIGANDRPWAVVSFDPSLRTSYILVEDLESSSVKLLKERLGL